METTSYNRWSRYLHWLVAGLIIFAVILGWRHEDHDSLRLTRITLHKSIGILVLLLCFARLGLRLAYKAPAEPPMPAWQALAAKALHVGFYVVMIALPLSGWLMVSTSTRPIPFFFLEVPHLPVPMGQGPEAHAAHETFETVHGLIAKLLIYAMIPLHVAAALKHHFVDKDSVMAHMVPGLTPKPLLNWRWLLPMGVALGAIALGYGLYRGVPEKGGERPPAPPSEVGSGASSAAEAVATSQAATASASSSSSLTEGTVPNWTVDKTATKIGWTTSMQGEAIAGGFSGYAAQIAFDPAQLDKSHVKVTIDLASVASGDADRDGSLKSDTFFNVGIYPSAVFEAKSFTKKDATHFVAHGTLTLHGVKKPHDLPFSLTIKDKVAQMTATTSVDRIAYGVGNGDYASTDTIPAKVSVNITLKARSS